MKTALTGMHLYQHDSIAMFRFVLRGELAGHGVQELEHAWITAQSILGGKELVVDIRALTRADAAAIQLLSRMRNSGARLHPALPSEAGDLVSSRNTAASRRLTAWRRVLRQLWKRVRPASRVMNFGICVGSRRGTGCSGTENEAVPMAREMQ